MGPRVCDPSTDDVPDVSSFDTAASGCAIEVLAELVHACVWEEDSAEDECRACRHKKVE